MNIKSYSDLEREILRYQNAIDFLNDSQKQYLKNLQDMKKAYDTVVDNLKAIGQIDLQNASNKEEAERKLSSLQNEIIEARKKLPESLQLEIIRNSVSNQANLNNVASIKSYADCISEYENLISEYNQITGDEDLQEIGLNYFDDIEKRYNEISAKRDNLFEAINALKGKVSEEELNHLLDKDSEFKEKIDRDIEEFKVIKQAKESFKEEKEREIKAIKDVIQFTRQQQFDSVNKMNNLSRINPNDPNIEKYRDIIAKLQKSISKDEKKLNELNKELDIILNGGKIEMTFSADEVVKQTKEEVKAITDEVEKQTQTQTQTQTEGSVPNKPKEPDTLDNLVKNGKLPNNLSREELIYICDKLNIQITDASTELSKEQIERLANDHVIQVALLNQKISDRNQRKISEYDKLIAEYESILKDKMEGKDFSDEYVTKVRNLLEKVKSEREIFVKRNEKITALDNSEILGTVSDLREDVLNFRATSINDKLRKQYEKLDGLKEKRENSRSKFKQKIEDARIKKTLARIEKLKGKKSVIADKQTQIVNKNAEKYISTMTKKIKKHLTKQGAVEMSVDKINDLSERIERNIQEREGISLDRQTETKLFGKIGLAAKDKILEAQTAALESERDVKDFVGRLR